LSVIIFNCQSKFLKLLVQVYTGQRVAANGGGLAKNWYLKTVSPKPKLNLCLNVDASFIG